MAKNNPFQKVIIMTVSNLIINFDNQKICFDVVNPFYPEESVKQAIDLKLVVEQYNFVLIKIFCVEHLQRYLNTIDITIGSNRKVHSLVLTAMARINNCSSFNELVTLISELSFDVSINTIKAFQEIESEIMNRYIQIGFKQIN